MGKEVGEVVRVEEIEKVIGRMEGRGGEGEGKGGILERV